jgi:hypothetical protein
MEKRYNDSRAEISAAEVGVKRRPFVTSEARHFLRVVVNRANEISVRTKRRIATAPLARRFSESEEARFASASRPGRTRVQPLRRRRNTVGLILAREASLSQGAPMQDDVEAVRGSQFADVEAARRAVALALPMLRDSLADKGVGESGCMHVVVMDPCMAHGDSRFEDAILYECSLPARERWDADYAWYARAKAMVAWRTGRASGELVARAPHYFRQGDTALGGSAVVDGIVVAVSGANPWFDEAFAACVANLLRAVAHERLARANGA